MTSTTPEFLVLFTVTCVLYFSLRRAGQNLVILGASLVFYGWWDWRFLFLILASTGVDYVCAIGIHEAASEKRRQRTLLAAMVLPLGISFYTFHAPSYAIDVYRRRTEPERNYLTYLSFVMFFPLLVAGPIERAWHLIPQLKSDDDLSDIGSLMISNDRPGEQAASVVELHGAILMKAK